MSDTSASAPRSPSRPRGTPDAFVTALCIRVMEPQVTIEDALFAKAAELMGISERSALLREGLLTLIRVETARRLAALGGTDPRATAATRRRMSAP